MNTVLFPTGPCVLTLVVIAMAFDLHARRIPNWLVVIALIAAMPIQIVANGMPNGPIWWIAGALTGGLLLMPGYLIRMLGAGDVKLMAAVGALLGPHTALEAVLITTAIGGLLSFVSLMRKRRLRKGVAGAMSMLIAMSADGARADAEPEHDVAFGTGSLPYGVAIAVGSVVTLMLNV